MPASDIFTSVTQTVTDTQRAVENVHRGVSFLAGLRWYHVIMLAAAGGAIVGFGWRLGERAAEAI